MHVPDHHAVGCPGDRLADGRRRYLCLLKSPFALLDLALPNGRMVGCDCMALICPPKDTALLTAATVAGGRSGRTHVYQTTHALDNFHLR